MTPLFDSNSLPRSQEQLEEGAMLLRGFAAAEAPVLVDEAGRIAQAAAFRHMVTPGGYTMSVAMTNCGRLGWVSDRTGYRYTPVDPDTGTPWPAMPEAFLDLAVRAAAEAGFAGYDPDACLINRYIAGGLIPTGQGQCRLLAAIETEQIRLDAALLEDRAVHVRIIDSQQGLDLLAKPAGDRLGNRLGSRPGRTGLGCSRTGAHCGPDVRRGGDFGCDRLGSVALHVNHPGRHQVISD